MAEKPQVPSPTKQIPSLTQLAERNKSLADKLAYHTNARNYIAGILENRLELPVLTLSPAIIAHGQPDTGEGVSIDLRQLSGDLVEVVLIAMLEHEEKAAFDVWQQLAETATSAVSTVEMMLKQRNLAMQQQKAENNILPFSPQTGPRMPPLPVRPQPVTAEENDSGYLGQEVPTGWPGRTDDEG